MGVLGYERGRAERVQASGGICGTFGRRRIRVSLATISALLFVATVVMLLRLPILRADG